MSARSRKVKSARISVALLLVLLLNADAHVFTHLGGVLQLLPTVGNSEDHGKSNALSPFGNHDCQACQSFQHLRPSAALPFVQLTTSEEAIITGRDAFPPIYNPAYATSDRAPPFV